MIASAALSRVQSYIDAVLDNEIVVCELVRAAVQRHADDLKRQSTPEFPYHFNVNHASIAIDFFPMTLRHSIGEFAGLPFELEPWQAFGVANIHGWKRDADESRRFRTVYWSTARKNGKSCWGAGEAIQLSMMDFNPVTRSPEAVAEVILCATKKEQAEKIIFAEVLRMRGQSPAIKAASTDINKQVTFRKNGGYITCVGSDRPYDGLNPHATFKDEVHAWAEYHRKFYDTITTGGGTRSQPLDVTTTTAGDDKSFIWLEEYNLVRGILGGTIKGESVFALCFELDPDDDPLDEANWIKANPNLGVSVKIDYLREQAVKAKSSKVALNRFTRYHGNRLVSSVDSAFDLDIWDKCAGELSDWKEADAIGGGVDLGARDDLAAWGLVARFLADDTDPDNPVWRYEIKSQAYIARDTVRDLTKQPFAEWCHDERLRVSKYPITEMRHDLVEACQDFGVNDVAYDPYNGQQFAEEIEQEGIEIASMSQNYGHFNEPIQDFTQAMTDGRLTHNGCPLLRWCIGNASTDSDRQDRVMFTKRDSSDKIDPVVATVMAYRRAMVAPRRPVGKMFVY